MAHIFSPLRTRRIALLWTGLSFSALGDQLYSVALAWVAAAALGASAGYLTALQAGVTLIAVIATGRWADRRDARCTMIVADLVRAMALISIVAIWMGWGRIGAAELVAAVIVLAIGQSVFQPALQSTLPELVEDRALLPPANGLLDATDRSARLLGPGLIGVIGGILPTIHFFTLDALSFLISAFAVHRIGRLSEKIPAESVRPERLLGNIARGVRALQGHPLLGFLFKANGLLNGAWYAAFYLALPLSIRHAGLTGPAGSGIAAFGLVISAYGCTNLLATLVIGSRPVPARPQAQIFGGNIVMGLGITALAASTLLPIGWQLYGMMASAALGAIGGPMKDIPVAVLRQTRLRREDLGPAMRAQMAVTNAGAVAAMVLVPSLMGALGVFVIFIGCGAVFILTGLFGIGFFASWTEGRIQTGVR